MSLTINILSNQFMEFHIQENKKFDILPFLYVFMLVAVLSNGCRII